MLQVTENPIFARRPEDAQRELSHRTTLLRATQKRRMVSALQSRNAVAEIAELPGPEESLHLVCRGNFPLWQIVPAVLTMAGAAIIEHLAIGTLGFSKQNAAELFDLIDGGKVRSVSIVASVYFQRQNPSEYKIMAEGLADRGQKIVAIRSHAKVIAMELSDGRGFTVESSANLRSCRNLEQLTLTQSVDLTRFHAGWIQEVIAAANTKKGGPNAR